MTAKQLFVPDNLDPVALADFLPRVGLALPPAAIMLAGRGGSMSACGASFTVAQVNEAFAKHDFAPAERIKIKAAMSDHRLIVG